MMLYTERDSSELPAALRTPPGVQFIGMSGYLRADEREY